MPSSFSKYCLLSGLIVFFAVLAYGNALNGPLFFDDLPNLTQNEPLKINGAEFDAWRSAAYSSGAGALRRPVSMLSFAANHAVFGAFTPFSLKAVNLVIHLLIAALVYYLSLAIFRTPALPRKSIKDLQLVSMAAAVIWLLHPLHVSTVLYSIQRMAQLSTLFVVFGLSVFIHYRLQWAERAAYAGEMFAAGLWLLLITLLATLSKENGALLPWLLAVVEVCLFRGRWRGSQSRVLVCIGWAALLLPLLLMSLIFMIKPGLFTAGYQARDFTLSERLFTQVRILWHYLYWLCVPDIRAMGFQHDDIAISRGFIAPIGTLLSLLALVLALVMAFIVRRRYPLILFSLFFFLVAHVMESSVLALEMVYEHRNYLPSIGIALLLAQILTSRKLSRNKVSVYFPVGCVFSVLLLMLVLRSQVWSGQMSLAQANLVNHPTSSRAQYFYATALLNRYVQGQEAGMSEEESRSLMVDIRQYHLQMLQRSRDDVLALVMLIYVDSYYFPGLGKTEEWFVLLEEKLEGRVLQATDVTALTLLWGCVGSGDCDVPLSRARALLNNLISANPANVRLLIADYHLLASTRATFEARISPLEKAANIDPRHPSVQIYRVLEMGKANEVGAMYEIVRKWLEHDPNRWALPVIKPLFSPADKNVGS